MKRTKAQGGEGQPFPRVTGVTSIAGLSEQTVPMECVCLQVHVSVYMGTIGW